MMIINIDCDSNGELCFKQKFIEYFMLIIIIYSYILMLCIYEV